MIDEIEKIMLITMGKITRISSVEITRILNDLDYKITERAVQYRIKKLENESIILGYSTISNPAYLNGKSPQVITDQI